jgi:hypothetical protein
MFCQGGFLCPGSVAGKAGLSALHRFRFANLMLRSRRQILLALVLIELAVHRATIF